MERSLLFNGSSNTLRSVLITQYTSAPGCPFYRLLLKGFGPLPAVPRLEQYVFFCFCFLRKYETVSQTEKQNNICISGESHAILKVAIPNLRKSTPFKGCLGAGINPFFTAFGLTLARPRCF